MSRFIDLHALQSIPFANLNRDDVGSPKSVTYGGVDRIRVSSQSWKHQIRHDVEDQLGEHAKRTRLVPRKVAERLAGNGWPAELADFAGAQIVASAVKGKVLKTDTEGKTSVLLYLPEAAINELAAVCADYRDVLEQAAGKAKDKKEDAKGLLPVERIAAILKSRTATIDLFGRMLAELPGAKVDGAVQVAHAFTTHASDPQGDFFTAVDDWLPDDQVGSGHMQTAEFSAGVFYRYATVNLEDLLANLDHDTERARELVSLFAEAFLMSLPQAKKNSTAPHTIPDLAYLAVRDRRPLSLAAAFTKPVYAGSDLAGNSRDALNDYAKAAIRLTGAQGRVFHGHAGVDDKPLDALGTRYESFPDLIAGALETAFAERGAPA